MLIKMAAKNLGSVCSRLFNKPFVFIFDETSDNGGKTILNDLVSALNNLEYVKPVVPWSNEILKLLFLLS